MPDRPAFHPLAPLLIGLALAALWLTLFPALAWLCRGADMLITRILW